MMIDFIFDVNKACYTARESVAVLWYPRLSWLCCREDSDGVYRSH